MLIQNWQELSEIDPSTQGPKVCTLIGSSGTKYITFDIKKYRGFVFHSSKTHAEFVENLTFGLENNMKNFANFHQSPWNFDKL